MQAYDWGLRSIGEPAAPASKGAGSAEARQLCQLWVVQELCNRGSLYDAGDALHVLRLAGLQPDTALLRVQHMQRQLLWCCWS